MRSFSVIFVVICNLLGIGVANAQNLSSFAGRFAHPQLLEDNAEALKFRLALLDNARKGSQVRIATFVFDYGQAVETLTAHICNAVRRGVKVELIADSKSGEIAGFENPYNSTLDAKKTEDVYQYLASCGANVFIHNYTMDYVTILGKRIPNIFGGQVPSGSSVNPVTALYRLSVLKTHASDALRGALKSQNISAEPKSLLNSLQSLAFDAIHLIGIAGVADLRESVDTDIEMVSKDYRNFLNDPFWDELDTKKMTAITAEFIKAIDMDPELRDLRNKLRVANRLNHRKLFLVEEPGGESCAIIGGRNLGDSYLTNSASSFRDGDVFFCTHHLPADDTFMKEANASLDQIKFDKTDNVLGPSGHNVVIKIAVKPGFQYLNLDTKRIHTARYIAEKLKGQDLPNFSSPVLLTSSWDPKSDGVRMALLEAIVRERKEIYIETAYAEFNTALCKALDQAMARGVKVHIVTNSLFMSDGASQLIRIWMGRWHREMAKKYGGKFYFIDYAPLIAGHMIHFKGAGFRCQQGLGHTFYREYIIGSHNFHPRSGYSDKENSLEWREATDSSCAAPENDMIAQRQKYYRTERTLSHAPVLEAYGNLSDELTEVSFLFNDTKNSDIARAIERAMYYPTADGEKMKLVLIERLVKLQILIDESGFRDLIGELM